MRNKIKKQCITIGSALLIGLALQGCPVDVSFEPQPGPSDEHWLRFAQLSDSHLNDEESPARAVRGDFLIGPAWRPQEAYAAQTLDATLRMLNDIHTQEKQNGYPIDFALATGDVTDNAHYNELRWFIDVMDGQWIVPDSGELDGELRDILPQDNPNLGFQAEGLAPDIPWYVVLGNHDNLAQGNFAICRDAEDPTEWFSPQFRAVAGILGFHALDPPTNAFRPTSDQSPAIIRASEEQIDPETLQLLVDQLDSGTIVSDPNRHYSSRSIFIEEHFNTFSEPVGHGFNETNRASGSTCYSVRPQEDVPIRLIVLDTVAPLSLWGFPMPYGVMTREQFESFLKPEVEAARVAGEFVIIVSHHPSTDFMAPYPGRTVGTLEFRNYLASRPNIIMHICGHTHEHRVTKVYGRYPYLEIETASLIDFPQEVRIFDVFYIEETKSIRVESTLVSHMDNPTRMSSESHRRTWIDAGVIEKTLGYPPDIDVAGLFPDPAEVYGPSCELPKFEGWAPPPSREQRYGRDADREFSVELPRP